MLPSTHQQCPYRLSPSLLSSTNKSQARISQAGIGKGCRSDPERDNGTHGAHQPGGSLLSYRDSDAPVHLAACTRHERPRARARAGWLAEAAVWYLLNVPRMCARVRARKRALAHG